MYSRVIWSRNSNRATGIPETGMLSGSNGGGPADSGQNVMSSTSTRCAAFVQNVSISTPTGDFAVYGSPQWTLVVCSCGCAGSGSPSFHTFSESSGPTNRATIR
jgi:hypothetical protein